MSPLFRDIQRDGFRVQEILGRMEEAAKSVDPQAADQFKLASDRVSNAVLLFRLGAGNPVPSVPAYAELGGES